VLADYRDRFSCARLSRRDGILEIALHTDSGPLVWGEVPHRELPELFRAVADDPDNRVVVLTGTGDAFCATMDPSGWSGLSHPAGFDKIVREGRRLLEAFLDIEVPMIAAVNGPVRVQAELPALCDIVLAGENAVFQDSVHVPLGAVPGDGSHIVWPLLLGPNRGRSFLLTGEELSARDAQALGVVAEVVAPTALADRAAPTRSAWPRCHRSRCATRAPLSSPRSGAR
jgi:enoyl-CoA hydratase/carnithine racemase